MHYKQVIILHTHTHTVYCGNGNCDINGKQLKWKNILLLDLLSSDNLVTGAVQLEQKVKASLSTGCNAMFSKLRKHGCR